MTCIRI
jgi:Fur family ferric uptake transcriptional regulator